jgi:hypothetical protein
MRTTAGRPDQLPQQISHSLRRERNLDRAFFEVPSSDLKTITADGVGKGGSGPILESLKSPANLRDAWNEGLLAKPWQARWLSHSRP